MDELKIRGLVFTYIRGFLQQNLDEKEFKDFLSSLPEHLRELLKGNVLETQHYPLEYHHEIVNEIHEKLSEKDPEIVSKLGEFVIKNAQEGPFKILFSTGDLKDYFSHIGSFTFKYFYSFGNFIIKYAFGNLKESDDLFDFKSFFFKEFCEPTPPSLCQKFSLRISLKV